MKDWLLPRVFVPGVSTAVLLWLSLPGGGELWPLLFFALIPFLLALRKSSVRQAIWLGLWCGLAHYLLLLYWIVIVLGRYGGVPLPLAVGALFLLASYMAFYFVVFALVAHRLFHWPRPFFVLLALPALWVGLDWVRSWLLTGLPWMDLGYGLAGVPWLLQSADIWGHHGLTWLIVLVNVLLASVIAAKGRKQLPLWGTVLLIFMLVAAYSSWRWLQLEKQVAAAETLRVGLVQGNIEQDMKWSPEWQQRTVDRYVEASRKLAAEQRPDLIIWPEAALPFYPIDHELLAPVQVMGRETGVPLLTGAPWYELDYEQEKVHFYNSALLQDTNGFFAQRYDKSHLVPFGEYVPLRRFLFFLKPLVETIGDFTVGSNAQALACEQARIGVLICFESIFPGLARKQVKGGATLLVNLTNDAWYGRSSAPHQNLAMAVLRSVENRRSLVRAANTGISAFIDPFGRVGGPSPLFDEWSGVADVALMEESSFYMQGGYLFAPICLLSGIVALFMAVFRGGAYSGGSGSRLEIVSR
ncbi:MAG: apolipoprotein N-acyltransferase [Desulfobulbaceae bacterium]|uniref:Apolipoprotein N-acyltransferase n=1 Tax=Candidatus Desulfatifera sulfidica TaxID=2841691 RepID=A0A8J6N7Y3_9BACT|nr:apolipoprotein N-acyltransferase [Candidatus Desulfatifera sulfidica]